jgi:hypothetical protein
VFGFKHISDDRFYNRRRLAVFTTIYAIVWGFVILFCDVKWGMDVAKVVAYLGFVSTVAGLPIWGYLRASQKDDNAKSVEEKTR